MSPRIFLLNVAKKLPDPVRRAGRQWWLKRSEGSAVPPLRMQRSLNEELPVPPPLPPGYNLVLYAPELEAQWLQLLNEGAEFGELNEAGFRAQLLDVLIGDGAAFVAHDGVLVACAAGCVLTPYLPAATLNYVVVRPEQRGAKLGQIVVTHVIKHCQRAGYPTMILHTDDHRLPAIKMYLRLGFVPVMDASPDAPARWNAVMDALGI